MSNVFKGSGTDCRKSGTPARQKTAKSGHPTFRNRKLYHYLFKQRLEPSRDRIVIWMTCVSRLRFVPCTGKIPL